MKENTASQHEEEKDVYKGLVKIVGILFFKVLREKKKRTKFNWQENAGNMVVFLLPDHIYTKWGKQLLLHTCSWDIQNLVHLRKDTHFGFYAPVTLL